MPCAHYACDLQVSSHTVDEFLKGISFTEVLLHKRELENGQIKQDITMLLRNYSHRRNLILTARNIRLCQWMNIGHIIQTDPEYVRASFVTIAVKVTCNANSAGDLLLRTIFSSVGLWNFVVTEV
jgi:hypothetical protein